MVYGVWVVLRWGVWGYWSVGWVGQWRFRVFRIRTETLSCARILRDSTPKNRVRWLFLLHTQESVRLSFGTISYASLSVITRMTRWRLKQPVNHPKNLSTKTRIFGCIYSGKFGTEVAASVMGSCHHPNMVTPQRVKPEMTVSKSSGKRVGNVTRKRKEPVRLLNGTLTISPESFVPTLRWRTCTRKFCQANM